MWTPSAVKRDFQRGIAASQKMLLEMELLSHELIRIGRLTGVRRRAFEFDGGAQAGEACDHPVGVEAIGWRIGFATEEEAPTCYVEWTFEEYANAEKETLEEKFI